MAARNHEGFLLMDYEYRNIDTDVELLKAARMYWEDHISKTEIYDILANKCYSKWEADRAFTDYYYIYVYSPNLIEKILYFWSFVSIIMMCCYILNIYVFR